MVYWIISLHTVCTGKGAQSHVTHPIVLCTFWDLSCVTDRYVHLAPEVCHTFFVGFGIILPYIVIFWALHTSLVHLSQVIASLVHHAPYVTSRCFVHLYLCIQYLALVNMVLLYYNKWYSLRAPFPEYNFSLQIPKQTLWSSNRIIRT